MRILLMLALAVILRAANYPAPVESDWVVHDFRFHTGEVLPDLRLHYTTIGNPTGEPVLFMHGSGGSARGFLTEQFADELFGPAPGRTPLLSDSSRCRRCRQIIETI
jgi:homoserine O-acetyltransferase/O-succinyltransferase